MNIFADFNIEVGPERYRIVLAKNVGAYGRHLEPRQQTLALIEVSDGDDGEVLAEGAGGSFLLPTDIYDEDKGIKNAVTDALLDLNEALERDSRWPLGKEERKKFWDGFFLELAHVRYDAIYKQYDRLLSKERNTLAEQINALDTEVTAIPNAGSTDPADTIPLVFFPSACPCYYCQGKKD